MVDAEDAATDKNRNVSDQADLPGTFGHDNEQAEDFNDERAYQTDDVPTYVCSANNQASDRPSAIPILTVIVIEREKKFQQAMTPHQAASDQAVSQDCGEQVTDGNNPDDNVQDHKDQAFIQGEIRTRATRQRNS